MAKWKIVITSNADGDAEKLENSYITGGNAKWHSHSEKRFSSSLQTKLEIDLPYRLTSALFSFVPQK